MLLERSDPCAACIVGDFLLCVEHGQARLQLQVTETGQEDCEMQNLAEVHLTQTKGQTCLKVQGQSGR